MIRIAALAALEAMTVAPSNAAETTHPTKDYVDCLISHVQTGTYHSRDGGIATLRLMAACGDQWQQFADRCSADGGKTVADCNLTAWIMAQSAILMRKEEFLTK